MTSGNEPENEPRTRPESPLKAPLLPLYSDQNRSHSSPFQIQPEKFKLAGWDIVESKSETDSSESSALRSKSSQRLRYEAEVSLIKRKLGDLEEIRNQLGLSQRKICQLLLVDPSAWTRWTRNDEDAPPHIYRSLQWYLALQEKYPALDVNFWLSTVAQVQVPALNSERDQKIEAIGAQVSQIKTETSRLAEEIQAGVYASLEKVFETKLKNELERERRASRSQNLVVILAAVLGSLVAGLLASRFF